MESYCKVLIQYVNNKVFKNYICVIQKKKKNLSNDYKITYNNLTYNLLHISTGAFLWCFSPVVILVILNEQMT